MKDVRQTESGKSNMAAFKVEVPSSQLVDKIGTESQRLNLCLRGPATKQRMVHAS